MRDPSRAPTQVTFPSIEDRLVEPETREEVLRGRTLYAAPSNPEHGDPHFQLDVVLGTNAKPGYIGSTDLLTRVADDGDFATDTCIRRAGVDPATGRRYLEEMAFEVVNTQRLSDVTAKAEDLTARGVRRVFAVFARKGYVSEWRDGEWERFAPDGEIVDDCLAAPLPVSALVRSGELGAAAVRGLLARGEPELKRLIAEATRDAEARGDLRGKRAMLRTVIAARGLSLSTEHDARIEACDNDAQVTRWATRAATAQRVDEVFSEA